MRRALNYVSTIISTGRGWGQGHAKRALSARPLCNLLAVVELMLGEHPAEICDRHETALFVMTGAAQFVWNQRSEERDKLRAPERKLIELGTWVNPRDHVGCRPSALIEGWEWNAVPDQYLVHAGSDDRVGGSQMVEKVGERPSVFRARTTHAIRGGEGRPQPLNRRLQLLDNGVPVTQHHE